MVTINHQVLDTIPAAMETDSMMNLTATTLFAKPLFAKSSATIMVSRVWRAKLCASMRLRSLFQP